VPFYNDSHIAPEASAAVQEDRHANRPVRAETVNVGVLRLPSISNFTDLEILSREPDVVVNYLFRPSELSSAYDLLVLPGAKNVMEDAVWLGRSGWKRAVSRFRDEGGRVLGICGGYQLLGRRISDPGEVEYDRGRVPALGLLPVDTELAGDKLLQRVTGTCLMNGRRVRGYEIHMGRTQRVGSRGRPFLRIHRPGSRTYREDGLFLPGGDVWGTYVHGILDTPGFREDLLNTIRLAKGLKPRKPRQGRLARFHQYDRLARHFEAHWDTERILDLVDDA